MLPKGYQKVDISSDDDDSHVTGALMWIYDQRTVYRT